MGLKKIICLYGGPGSGKSTTAAGLFCELKRSGFNTELNRGFVKDWCWEGRDILPGDQTYIFAKQSRKERLYIEQNVEVIVNDSPLLLTHFYGLKYDWLEQACNTSKTMLEHHHHFCKYKGYSVDHYFLTRGHPYKQEGRYQTEEEGIKIDEELKRMLNDLHIRYTLLEDNSIFKIIEDIKKEAKKCLV